jgi:hypothetical protein
LSARPERRPDIGNDVDRGGTLCGERDYGEDHARRGVPTTECPRKNQEKLELFMSAVIRRHTKERKRGTRGGADIELGFFEIGCFENYRARLK